MMWTGHKGVKARVVCMRISRVNVIGGLVDTREWDQRTWISRSKVMPGNHADTTTGDRYTSLKTCIPIRTSTVTHPSILHNPSHLGPT